MVAFGAQMHYRSDGDIRPSIQPKRQRGTVWASTESGQVPPRLGIVTEPPLETFAFRPKFHPAADGIARAIQEVAKAPQLIGHFDARRELGLDTVCSPHRVRPMWANY